MPPATFEVVGRGADRVDRVVGVLAAVAVGVEAVRLPSWRAGTASSRPRRRWRRSRLVPNAGLDFVDRGEHLPGDPVLGSAGLVDRQQEGRDLEGVDDEVGDADRGRAEGGDRRRRVGAGRGAAVAELRAAVGAFGLRLIAGGRARGADAAAALPPFGCRGPGCGDAAAAAAGFARRRGRRRCGPPPAVCGASPALRGFGRRRPPPLPRVVSAAEAQSGSSRSIRPSPSSSTPFAQAGGCAVGRAGVGEAAGGLAVAEAGRAGRRRPCRRRAR